MRHTIPITSKRRNGQQEIRLFTMTERQSTLFTTTVQVIARDPRVSTLQAQSVVEKAIVSMLGGKMPREEMPTAFHEMRLAFPILKPKDVRKLPRHGCPRGRITAIILGVTVDQGQRTVLYELDADQANWHRDAMEEIRERDGCTKDEAWVWTNNLVGQLSAGATMKDTENSVEQEMILMRAVSLFPELTKEAVLKLPLATELDVRRWSFTEDKSRD